MRTQEAITDTVRRMQDDDLARQMVLRYQRDPHSIFDSNSLRARRIYELARRVIAERRMPRTVGEWLSVMLHYASHQEVIDMRQQARRESQAAYVQSARWLRILDELR